MNSEGGLKVNLNREFCDCHQVFSKEFGRMPNPIEGLWVIWWIGHRMAIRCGNFGTSP